MNRLVMVAVWLVCVLADSVALVWMLFLVLANSTRGFRAALAHDVVWNVTLGGNREPISSRCWRYRDEKCYADWVWFINLMARDPAHCRQAFEAEQRRRKTDSITKPMGVTQGVTQATYPCQQRK